ncbi:MAG: NAD+ synthase [Deltaproteobacteria bacterium]|nr:NAD+ synthase [Deltaproteobacteria bacterium]
MKIALAQTNPTVGALEKNVKRMLEMIHEAKSRGCRLVIFPELSILGYPPKDLLEKADFVESNLRAFRALVESVRGIGVICGYVKRNTSPEGKSLFNTAALFENGDILYEVEKCLLPCYDVFEETRYFEPGKPKNALTYGGIRLGISICEDIWNDKDFFPRQLYHSNPVESLVSDGAEILVNISASPYHREKLAFRQHMLGGVAKKYARPVIYVNQVGGNDSLIFDGASLAFDADGTIVTRGVDFEEDLIVYDTESGTGDIHPVATSDTESVLRALIMGLRDYCSKCGFKGVVLGLSGGIDSSLVAYIATKALGPEHVLGVSLPSRYSSEGSRTDARKLAENLGIRFHLIPIEEIYGTFLNSLESVFAGRERDVTEENIQARIRGNILMALSNKLGYLVLATGNKSEVGVGYCTLYGDTCGGLAVISDVPKTMVYELCRFINQEEEIIPPAVLLKAPSAELRPDQTDQDTLPPYEILDPILQAYVEDLRSAEDIVAMGFAEETVRRVIKMVESSEYKRQQMAPGLKVTTKAFGFGRKLPIAQGYLG